MHEITNPKQDWKSEAKQITDAKETHNLITSLDLGGSQ